MDTPNQKDAPQDTKPKEPKKISTTVTCPHCGKQHDVTVEIPEQEDTPKMAWQG